MSNLRAYYEIPPIALVSVGLGSRIFYIRFLRLTVWALFEYLRDQHQELSGKWVPTEFLLDHSFRPADCHSSHNVKGRNRREMIRDYYAAGKLDQLSDKLLRDSLSDGARSSVSKIHPTFIGGEYLPNYGRQEVEIARIALASTTSDVISLRARPSGPRMKYRVVDEYQTEFQLPQQTSRRPFSLGQLIRFLDSVEHPEADAGWKRFGFVLSFNECNLTAELTSKPCVILLASLPTFTRSLARTTAKL
jgi:hypothetical protein